MTHRHTPPHTRPAMRRMLAVGLCTFWLLARVSIAQHATNSGASSGDLPLRNIQIEVRQVLRSNQERNGLAADGGIASDSRNSSAQQQVLVINGRSAAIGLRTTTPFRLMQTQFRNGVPVLVPGIVLLDAATGFVATPRWDGSGVVELALSATQAGAPAASGQVLPATGTRSASTVLVALGEWVTVAQSDQESQSSRSGWAGQSGQVSQQSHELQVRLSVR